MIKFDVLVEGIGACVWYRFISSGSKSWTIYPGSVCYASFNLRILLATLFVCFGRDVWMLGVLLFYCRGGLDVEAVPPVPAAVSAILLVIVTPVVVTPCHAG